MAVDITFEEGESSPGMPGKPDNVGESRSLGMPLGSGIAFRPLCWI